jgi:hypothetical protein
MRCSRMRWTVGLAAAGSLLVASAVEAQEPPTVPDRAAEADTLQAEVASSPPVALDARLSPDGRSIAYRVLEDGIPRLYVRGVAEAPDAAHGVDASPAGVSEYAWAPDGRHILFSGEAGGGVWVVRLPEPSAVASEAVRPRELIAVPGGEARIAGFAPDPLSALVEVPGQWPAAPDLVRVELATGARSPVVQNEGGVRRWVVDEDGAPRLGIRRDEDGGTELARYRDGALVPIYRCAADETCDAVGFHPDGRLWIRSDRGRGAPALLLLDPLTFEEEVVRTDAGDDVHGAFREESAAVEATARVRALVGGDAALTFHEPRAEGGRLLVTARTPAGAELLLLDRWAGSVGRMLPLAAASESPAAPPVPRPDVLVPARLEYRVTDDDPLVPPTDLERTIESTVANGVPVWRVVDVADVPTYEMPSFAPAVMEGDAAAVDDAFADDPDHDPFAEFGATGDRARATDTTVLDAVTLEPIRRRADGPVRLELDYADGTVTGLVDTQGFERPVDVDVEGRAWSDGAALEMLVAASPLAAGYRSRITLLDTQTLDVAAVTFEVRGAQEVTTDAGTFDAWRLTFTSDADAERVETWLVRRAAPHYLVRAELRTGDLVRITELTGAEGLR